VFGQSCATQNSLNSVWLQATLAGRLFTFTHTKVSSEQVGSQIRPGACVRPRGIITYFICSAQDNASWRVLALCSLHCLQCQIKANAWPGSKPGMSRWQINHLPHLSRAAGHHGPVLTKEGKWECFTHSVPALCHAWRYRL